MDMDIRRAPFRAKVRLTERLENNLLQLPQFEAYEPNTDILSELGALQNPVGVSCL